MKAKSLLSLITPLILTLPVQAADWDDFPIPAAAGNGKIWQLVDSHSDEFNYQGKGSEFDKKWNDRYFNGWSGPGLTEWSSDRSWVSNGNLVLRAARKPGTNKVNLGVVTSKTKLKYPLYMESRILVANQVLSSNFWLLSDDDKRELDILEIYGSDRPDHTWFAARPSTNYHVFIRNESNNAIQADHNDQKHHTLPNEAPYRNAFHRFGAYWKDAWNVDFYIDGKLVRSLNKQGLTDPENRGLDRSMFLIFDLEDHEWRSNQGFVATDKELADNSKNRMYIDWVRVYKPIESSDNGGSDDITPPSGWTNLKLKHSGKCLDVANGKKTIGSKYHQWGCNTGNANQRFQFNHRGNGWYGIKAKVSNLCVDVYGGNTNNGGAIHQWVCDGSNINQSWKIVPKENGWFELESKRSQKCLDVADRSIKNAAKIQQWDCYSSNNQLFKFVK